MATVLARHKSHKIMEDTTRESHCDNLLHVHIKMLEKFLLIFKCSKYMLNDNPARIHRLIEFVFAIESNARGTNLKKFQQISTARVG